MSALLDALLRSNTTIERNGVLVGTTPKINYLTGDAVAVNESNRSIDVTIPSGGGGGGGDVTLALPQYVFVVADVAVPPETPDGTWSKPFSSLGDAVTAAAALPAGNPVTFLLCGGGYTSVGTLSPRNHTFISLCAGGTSIGNLGIDAGDTGPVVTEFQNCSTSGLTVTGSADFTLKLSSDAPGGAVMFGELATGGKSGGTDVAQLSNCIVAGGISGSTIQLTMFGGAITSTIDIANLVSATGTIIANCNITVANVGLYPGLSGCTFAAMGTFAGPASSFIADKQSRTTFVAAGGALSVATVVQTDVDVILSPPQLTASVDNWSPDGLSGADVIVIDADTAHSINGIDATDCAGHRITILNSSASTVTIANQQGSSLAANRIAVANGGLPLNTGESAELQYITPLARWYVIANTYT